MSYTMIKHCKMDWEIETHKFTFVTGGDGLIALDSLSDLIGSLQHLYEVIGRGGIYNNQLPKELKVEGGCGWAVVEGEFDHIMGPEDDWEK